MAVYDCFTFFNEYELLELRLKTLNNVVDYFVICELDVTQSGEKKPYNFEIHKNQYREYWDKIIYLKETDAPILQYGKSRKQDSLTMNGDWAIENYQRNCIMHGLQKCRPDDLIILSDLDEIPNPKILKNIQDQEIHIYGISSGIREWIRSTAFIISFFTSLRTAMRLLFGKRFLVKDILPYMPVALELNLFYYFLNCKSRGLGRYPAITYYKNMFMPQVLRNSARHAPYIKNGGWHFSYMGGVERIKKKLSSIIEGNSSIAKDNKYIEYCLDNGLDLYGRKGKEFLYDFIDISDLAIPDINKFIKKYPYLYREKNKR